MEKKAKNIRRPLAEINSLDELNSQRELLAGMDDEELVREMEREWIDGADIMLNTTGVDFDKDGVKYSIDQLIEKKNRSQEKTVKAISDGRRVLWRRVATVAASVVVAGLVYSTYYLYKQTTELMAQKTTITTGEGERVTVNLPDNTTVVLNALSWVTFSPEMMQGELREVVFQGEGYFDVAHHAQSQFVVRTTDVTVRVLGTKFNLAARDSARMVELTLDQGSVMFSARHNASQSQMSEKHKATYDKLTGNIVVDTTLRAVTAPWRHSVMVFRNASLDEIAQELKNRFSINISIGQFATRDDLFSGTVSALNLNEALTVLEKVYRVRATIIGQDILLDQIRVCFNL